MTSGAGQECQSAREGDQVPAHQADKEVAVAAALREGE